MFRRLSEADSWIQHHLFRCHARRRQPLPTLREELHHLGHHVAVLRPRLHRCRRPSHVHADVASAGRRHQSPHRRVRAVCRDVVDDARPRRQRRRGHRWLHRVNGERHGHSPGQRLDHRQHAPQFLRLAHRFRAGSRGFAADVENLRALGHQLQRVSYCGFRWEELPAIGKRIRRHVHDPHHQHWAGEAKLKLAGAEKHDLSGSASSFLPRRSAGLPPGRKSS